MWLKMLPYKFLIWKEQMVYKMMSSNSTLQFEKVDFVNYTAIFGMSKESFYKSHSLSHYIIYDPMYYAIAVSELINKVYSSTEQEIVVDLVATSGLFYKYKIIKKRKKPQYSDKVKLLYFLRVISIMSFTRKAEKKSIRATSVLLRKEFKKEQKGKSVCGN